MATHPRAAARAERGYSDRSAQAVNSFFVPRALADRKVPPMRNFTRCSAAKKAAIQVGRSENSAKAQD